VGAVEVTMAHRVALYISLFNGLIILRDVLRREVLQVVGVQGEDLGVDILHVLH
jgi:hypothetical protein